MSDTVENPDNGEMPPLNVVENPDNGGMPPLTEDEMRNAINDYALCADKKNYLDCFKNQKLKGKPFNAWNVSEIKNMSNLFSKYNEDQLDNILINFNEPLDKWDVSNVTDMSSMFKGCKLFNQDLSKWKVSNVTNMSSMFEKCTSFNQNLSGWNVGNVTNMGSMFERCTSFNHDLSGWVFSNVTDMSYLFYGCKSFNQPLNTWRDNIGNVTNMGSMFEGCTAFNKPLDNWIVNNVTDMSSMFEGCTSFNQPLDKWNVSNVTNMGSMFYKCKEFNQPLDKWDVSNVTNMSFMFNECTNFNQNLSGWNINMNVVDKSNFLNTKIQEPNSMPPFKTNIFMFSNMSIENYPYTIILLDISYIVNTNYLDLKTYLITELKILYPDITDDITPNNLVKIISDLKKEKVLPILVNAIEKKEDHLKKEQQKLYKQRKEQIKLRMKEAEQIMLRKKQEEIERKKQEEIERKKQERQIEKERKEERDKPLEEQSPLLKLSTTTTNIDFTSYNYNKFKDPLQYLDIPFNEVMNKSLTKFIILNENATGGITLDISYFTEKTFLNLSNILYKCNEVGSANHFKISRDIRYFNLRKLGLSGVVNVQEIYSMLNKVKNEKVKIFKISNTNIKLPSTISYDVLFHYTTASSAAHCQAGQDQNVYSIQIVNNIPIQNCPSHNINPKPCKAYVDYINQIKLFDTTKNNGCIDEAKHKKRSLDVLCKHVINKTKTIKKVGGKYRKKKFTKKNKNTKRHKTRKVVLN